MFKMSEIRELIKLVDQSGLCELEIENENSKLVIRKPVQAEPTVQAVQGAVVMPTQQPAAQPPLPTTVVQTDDNTLHKITSPMVGTFYAAPSPTSAPFVGKGDKVNAKTVVCIVEAMKLMNEIEAEVRGEIVDVLVENGQLVEFGQPLFLVKPE